ncbi:unnamed protein product [Anisakis simplex]|uniref:Uncharacterized protein n=1 Tax=Anisakis simplex TaxID=6269 RepID=A0A0M3J3Q0_ANISI|nr:unnamed protein product [Anisakis simplex]
MCSRMRNGVNGTWQFAVSQSDNGVAKSYVFDMRKSEFVISDDINSNQFRHIPFSSQQLQNISGAIKWLGIIGIDNSDLILVFLFEQRTKKFYLVMMKDEKESMKVIEEHFVYIERIVELTQALIVKGE